MNFVNKQNEHFSNYENAQFCVNAMHFIDDSVMATTYANKETRYLKKNPNKSAHYASQDNGQL